MELATVKDSAMQIALAINKIIGVDVVIVDKRLVRIADTFRYNKDRIEIRKESIVGRIIESGRPLAIDDKMVFRSCIDCHDFSSCRMQSLIGVPIICGGQTSGAIALAISQRHRKELFGNLAHTVGFLEKMAEMLAGKLQNEQDYEQLEFAKKQREVLVDAIEDGVVLVSNEGRIVHYNKAFDNLFLNGHPAVDRSLVNVLIHPQIDRYFQDKKPFINKLVYCESRHGSFDGHITVVPFSMGDTYHGAVFTFRRIAHASMLDSTANRQRYAPANLLAGDGAVAKLRRKVTAAAHSCDAVLLEGKSQMRQQEIAFCIHNASARQNGNFLVVNCKKFSPQELEEELFGTAEDEAGGKIRLAHKGTLCLCEVEYLPQYLQRRLCDYLVRGIVVISNGETVSDARLILTTGQNLEKMAEEGLFDDVLYDRVSGNRIKVYALVGQPSEAQEKFVDYIHFFSQQYNVGQMEIEPGVLDAITECAGNDDMPQLRTVAEYLVKTAHRGIITMAQFPHQFIQQPNMTQISGVDDFVKGQICHMQEDGKSNNEIAATLQISRATLYRKLKKYNIKRKEIHHD